MVKKNSIVYCFFHRAIPLITLVVLVWYAIDTNRIANQTVEANLRPIILRSGYLEKWGDIGRVKNNNLISGQALQFTIQKNIAKDIKGYVVIDQKKYPLLFGNDISKRTSNPSNETIIFNPNWGWMNVGGLLYAVYDERKFSTVRSKNCIYISYKDIEGNKYFTREDKNFSQTCGKK